MYVCTVYDMIVCEHTVNRSKKKTRYTIYSQRNSNSFELKCTKETQKQTIIFDLCYDIFIEGKMKQKKNRFGTLAIIA